MKKRSNNQWASEPPKSATESFINYINDEYYHSYSDESGRYEKINNRLFGWLTAIGFLTTFLIGIKEMLSKYEDFAIVFKILIFILPLTSSFLLIYLNQKGYKKKEELREYARIESKYLVNEAKLRFSHAKSDTDYEAIYRWLNEEIKNLQLNQANGYLTVHNDISSVRS